MKKIIKEHYKSILIITILSILSMIPLLITKTRYMHDEPFHLSNAILIESVLTRYKLLLPEIFNSYGYGTHLFYPSFPHLVLAVSYHILKIFKLDVLDSLIIVNVLISIISSIMIYHLAYKLLKKKNLAILSVIIFLASPYRISDFVTRCSFNECFIFIFAPMIFLGMMYLLENKYKEFYIYFIIGYVGMFNCHLVMSLYLTILIVPLLFLNINKFFKWEVINRLLLATLIVVLICLPFFVTVLENMGGDYLVYQKGYMSSLEYMDFYSLNPKEFFDTNVQYNWDVLYYFNIVAFILEVVTIFFAIITKDKDKNNLYFYILFILCIIISSKLMPWKYLPGFFYMIQFPWRTVTFLTIALSVTAPALFVYIKNKKINTYVPLLLMIGTIAVSIPCYYKLTTDYYEFNLEELDLNMASGHSKEYLPTKLTEDYINNKGKNVNNLTGNGLFEIVQEDYNYLVFNATYVEDAYIELPKIYYKGYTLKNGSSKIELSKSDTGLIKAYITENGTYTLEYTGTLLYNIAKYVSIISWIGFISMIIYIKKKEK